jgi:hypothetical protein
VCCNRTKKREKESVCDNRTCKAKKKRKKESDSRINMPKRERKKEGKKRERGGGAIG